MVCGSSATRLIAEVDAHFLTGVRVEKCGACHSLRLIGPMHQYTSDDTAIDDYVEGGASLDAIALAMCRVRRGSVKRFLDVGCNYGFGVHIAQHLFGWEALGVEPSPAGRRGQAELGVEIRADFLDDATDIGQPFDLILASEVVEHVSDPVDFLSQLRRRLTASGVVVLTTPSAEVMAAPLEREEQAVQALSPGFHYFLASVRGMEILLEEAGFRHHRVLRHGATLQVVAASSPEGWGSIVDEPTLDQTAFLRYLDAATDAAPYGSALASGMASRHFRACVMNGDFVAAEKSSSRLGDVMLAKNGFDLDDPRSVIGELNAGRRPAWNLAGVAYCKGMVELIDRRVPERAVSYFELADRAARAWRDTSGLLDVDLWNLRELSLGHRCLAIAMTDPESAGPATDRLAEVLDKDVPVDARRIAWWKVRTFNELVARGHLDVQAALAAEVEASVDALVWSSDVDFRRAGLDALFLLGVRALNSGSATISRQWFTRCASACDAMPEEDAHARELGETARRHDTLATSRGGEEPLALPARGRRFDPGLTIGIDAYWCDASGMYLRGFAHAGPAAVQTIALCCGDRRVSQQPTKRQDVADLYPDGVVPSACGFALYLAGRPGDQVSLELDIGDEQRWAPVELPSHSLPVLEQPPERRLQVMIRRLMAEAGAGPVLTVGGRAGERTDVSVLNRKFGDRVVFNVDIHTGSNVDVVGDVHQLSRFFRGGSFAAAFSASLLEHVVAPWLVAAEINVVLELGAPVLHVAPTSWPEHAMPNDFWRFTADGLATLFGPATGFEVLDKGAVSHLRLHPDPRWRRDHLDMPTMAASDQSWVLARKVSEIDGDALRWPYDPVEGERAAKAYPVDGIIDEVKW
jgi:SAM-dependent methyltransferase